MRRVVPVVILALAVVLSPALALAQARPVQQPTPTAAPVRPGDEIKLDESTSLKAAALEARLSALLANFALLQRQAQDMQLEWQKMLEERKALIEGAARRMSVDPRDTNEWVLDSKGQRYVRVQRPPATGGQPPQR